MARWWTRNRREYENDQGDEHPLTGYTLLMGTYGALVASGVAVAAARRSTAAAPTGRDLALIATATFMTSRPLSHDAVTSPLRSPATTFVEPAGPGEVTESPCGGSVRHAVGELVTCPFCISQWLGTAFVAGHAIAPRATRWAATTMTVRAVANGLQAGYSLLEQKAQG